MHIYTSSFWRARILSPGNKLQPISIARSQPRGFDYPEVSELAPSGRLLHDYKAGRVTKPQYVAEYNLMLSIVDFHDILQQIRAKAGDNEAVLCCWEQPGDFCHRHVVAGDSIRARQKLDV